LRFWGEVLDASAFAICCFCFLGRREAPRLRR